MDASRLCMTQVIVITVDIFNLVMHIQMCRCACSYVGVLSYLCECSFLLVSFRPVCSTISCKLEGIVGKDTAGLFLISFPDYDIELHRGTFPPI